MSALKTSDVEGSNAYVIAQCSAFKPHRAPTQHGWIAWHTETFSWPCEPRDFRPSKDQLLRKEVLSRLSFHVLTGVREFREGWEFLTMAAEPAGEWQRAFA